MLYTVTAHVSQAPPTGIEARVCELQSYHYYLFYSTHGVL